MFPSAGRFRLARAASSHGESPPGFEPVAFVDR